MKMSSFIPGCLTSYWIQIPWFLRFSPISDCFWVDIWHFEKVVRHGRADEQPLRFVLQRLAAFVGHFERFSTLSDGFPDNSPTFPDDPIFTRKNKKQRMKATQYIFHINKRCVVSSSSTRRSELERYRWSKSLWKFQVLQVGRHPAFTYVRSQ